MNAQQLKNWLTARLKEAEPLDSESAMEKPRHVAVTATKKLGLLRCGDGALYHRATDVETAQDCAAILMDCLSLLPEDVELRTPSNGALSVPEVAEILGVSKETVYKRCAEGTIAHQRIGNRITITPHQLAQFQELANV